MAKSMFGTDGVRGKVGQRPITPEGFLQLGWALAQVLKAEGSGAIVVGRDTRLSGQSLSLAFSAGVLAAGLDVIDCGVLPTPGVACLVKSLSAQAGVMVSASHNPYYDNGLKCFNHDGAKFSREVEGALTHFFESPLQVTGHCGHVKYINDGVVRYLEFLKAQVPNLDCTGMSIAVDSANGACFQVGPRLLESLGANLICMANSPDGLNINSECGATNVERLRRCVLENRCDLGIAVDGDGDRLILVDHLGQTVDGDQIVFILAKAWQKSGRLSGGVVGTLMSNVGQENALGELGIAFERSNVGDAYVLEKLRNNGWNLGGESSGHILCLDHAPTGDGLLTALLILEVLSSLEVTLADLAAEMPKLPSILKNVPAGNPTMLATDKTLLATVKKIEGDLGKAGRVLLRPSGTEPLVRILVEGSDLELITTACNEIALVAKALSEKA